MGINPLVADEMEFYRIEYLLEDLEEKINEENKRYKKQEEAQKKDMQASKATMPKIGGSDFGGFKTPKLSSPKMPNISMPKI